MKGRIMPKPSLSTPDTSTAPVVIAIEGATAGFALRDNHRFRFFSGHPRFDLLDGSRFTHIQDVQWAVKRLAQATAEAKEQSSEHVETRELATA
jgi:hypothetical protein